MLHEFQCFWCESEIRCDSEKRPDYMICFLNNKAVLETSENSLEDFCPEDPFQ